MTDISHRVLRERFRDLRLALDSIYRLAAERDERKVMTACSIALQRDRETASKLRKVKR